MKIYCEKCQKDITVECNKNIENYKVGKTICPHCHYEQKRYISEADLLLYFGISEVFYVIFTYLSVIVINLLGITFTSIFLIFGIFILYYILAKMVSTRIYVNAYFKEDVKNKAFEEDGEAIEKNITWQFVLFFVIAITYMTLDEARLFFGLMLPLAPILTFIKFYLQIKKEKGTS